MLRVVVVDDDISVVKVLKKFIPVYNLPIEIAGAAENVADGMEVIKKYKPDIVLLDIEMPDGTGFDLLRNFSEEINFKIIFISAHNQYAVKAFKFSAVDYLLKPLNGNELSEAFKKAQTDAQKDVTDILKTFQENINSLSREIKKIVIKTFDHIYIIPVNKIIRCEADINYTRFFIDDGRRIFVSTTLKEYEELLGEYNFFRTHQSHLINIDYIDSYNRTDGMLLLKDSTKIPVSSRKKEALIELMERL